MAWSFKNAVHCAAVGRDLVILDLESDAYFCMPDVGDFRAGVVEADDLPSDVLAGLVDADLVEPSSRPVMRSPPPLPATSDLRHGPAPRLGPIDALRATRVLMDLRRAGADAPVSRLLALAGPEATAPSDPDLVFKAAARFAAMLPWLPVRNQCLHRSALLMRYLNTLDLTADWVFGVRTWPFRAHCWVQTGDVCLNDDKERLRAYTAILCR